RFPRRDRAVFRHARFAGGPSIRPAGPDRPPRTALPRPARASQGPDKASGTGWYYRLKTDCPWIPILFVAMDILWEAGAARRGLFPGFSGTGASNEIAIDQGAPVESKPAIGQGIDETVIMGRHEHGRPGGIDVLEDFDDFPRSLRIQVSRGFVRQNDIGLVGHGPG